MEEELAGRRSGVAGVGQTLELYSLLLKLADQIDQMLDAAAQPVEFPDHKRIAATKTFSRLYQPWAFSSCSANPVLKDLLAASFSKSLQLKFQVLVLR